MMILFYTPFLYTIQTRLKSKAHVLSWLVIYIIPVFFCFSFFNEDDSVTTIILKGVLGILLIYNLYEVGYIYNDAETIKKEKKPTYRLSPDSLDYYEKNKYSIYSVRFVAALIISIMIFIFFKNVGFLFAAWSIIILYAIYNNIRNIFNLPIHFLLVTVRFCSLLILYSPIGFGCAFILMIFIFPVINTLERCSEKRFDLALFQNMTLCNKKDGRYKYYLALLLVSFVLLIIEPAQATVVFTMYCIYFFIYRYLLSRIIKDEF
ncbi:hypothetical protein F3J34_23195 [Klebsiella sp. Ap-873]|nr:hypothetical protein [Klebsiella sp. Ap-873]